MEGKYSCLDANKYLLSRGQSPLQRHLILGSNLEEGRNEICQGYQKLTTIQLLYRYTSFPTLARKVNSTEGLSIPLQIFQITWQVLFLVFFFLNHNNCFPSSDSINGITPTTGSSLILDSFLLNSLYLHRDTRVCFPYFLLTTMSH